MMQNNLLAGESQERILYLAQIGVIFERLYDIKDLNDAKQRAVKSAGVTANMLLELGYTERDIENLLRKRVIGGMGKKH
ncbi:hypothetical protein AV654_19750 [Paenibacillus elgii]|uniref:Uncharacterized protein n=1 Tax=Paenibacillus elgii TaxID=189691 RepID=A0A165R335_9BACL|nr:hypothetical protein [Paenibacillus elgii]KZE78212.1 hypothetical protein AV654_19750 [Paenibacillus elgii]